MKEENVFSYYFRVIIVNLTIPSSDSWNVFIYPARAKESFGTSLLLPESRVRR